MKTLFLDMYGVILKESKGRLIQYAHEQLPVEEHARIERLIRQEGLFTKAGLGEIDSDEFLTRLGFDDVAHHMRNYLVRDLHIDEQFHRFARQFSGLFRFALLSNDVGDWSRLIMEHHDLNQYFSIKIVSADVRCRKPDPRIFEIALDRAHASANDCLFVDNSVSNLDAAERLGIEPILFNRDGEAYGGQTVYSFDELALLLAQKD